MELHFGDTSVTVCAWGTLIALPDGTLIPGAPQDDAAYRTTAERHGYGPDTLQLCIDHEILHVALADWLACQSPTLEALQTQRLDDNLLLRGLEEDAVLAIQRYARMAGIDIVELFASRSRDVLVSPST